MQLRLYVWQLNIRNTESTNNLSCIKDKNLHYEELNFLQFKQ